VLIAALQDAWWVHGRPAVDLGIFATSGRTLTHQGIADPDGQSNGAERRHGCYFQLRSRGCDFVVSEDQVHWLRWSSKRWWLAVVPRYALVVPCATSSGRP
jgi:hypothetical protein